MRFNIWENEGGRVLEVVERGEMDGGVRRRVMKSERVELKEVDEIGCVVVV